MEIHVLDASKYVQNANEKVNYGRYQSDVGSGASGLNRSRERSNECQSFEEVSETLVLNRNGVVDSSR